MVELSDPKGPVQEGIDNSIFIVPGIIVAILIIAITIEEEMESVGLDLENVTLDENTSDALVTQPGVSAYMGLLMSLLPGGLIGFFVYKLVKSLRDKEKAKEEKKKMKQARKEKELSKKQKKK